MPDDDTRIRYWLNDELVRRSGTGLFHRSAEQQAELLELAKERLANGATIREIVRDWQLGVG